MAMPIILHPRKATLANLGNALDPLRNRGSGGTMLYSGHGISHGPDPIADFGLCLDGEDKLTARDVIDRASNTEKPALPARVVLEQPARRLASPEKHTSGRQSLPPRCSLVPRSS